MITFPTTPEAFIAYHEERTGRKLEGFERSLASTVVELANFSYQEGIDGDAKTVTTDDAETFFRERGREAEFTRLAHTWESISFWCEIAYQAGRREWISNVLEHNPELLSPVLEYTEALARSTPRCCWSIHAIMQMAAALDEDRLHTLYMFARGISENDGGGAKHE